MSAAQFDYAKWAAMFPDLADGGVTESIALGFFEVAELIFANNDCSPIKDPAKRLVMLNYIVAHLARLAGYPAGAGDTAGPSGMVGRVTSATEGSVSVSSGWAATVSDSEAWWIQTPEGATFWQLTRALRTARYIAPPPRYFGPARRAFGGRWLP